VGRGGQAYLVFPLIGTEAGGLKEAEGAYRRLKREVFPDRRLALLHSRVPEPEKVMAEFAAGRLDILVATSVMEVGVDVPNANCLVVHQSESFGLASLHQLRGRVGRGPRQSYAFLVYGEGLEEAAAARLKAVHGSTDGFALAEEDLRLRGPGEFLGQRQSGALRMPLGVADLARDWEICRAARADALELVGSDPDLARPENTPVREVLAIRSAAGGGEGWPAGQEGMGENHGWIL
jgi:ATP-dependent DNA helicase RecG